ncbi:MAG: VWA domain-containing protein [Blastocatellia bacterium]|nr:VWA domain-containing protein [Blastocatellia bacterium]
MTPSEIRQLIRRFFDELRARGTALRFRKKPAETARQDRPANSHPEISRVLLPAEAPQLVRRFFDELRARDFDLGPRELLDVLKLIEDGWEYDSAERLREDLGLLWRHFRQTPGRDEAFEDAWLRATEREPASRPDAVDAWRHREDPGPERQPESARASTESESQREASAAAEASILPAQPAAPSDYGQRDRVAGYLPISREMMAHGLRALRRPRRDGPLDVLDVPASIERAARMGFFLDAVFHRRETNHAHLVLLVDQGGSMVPFHRFARDLAETALAEQEHRLRKVEVYYFHNYFAGSLHRDPYLTEEVGRDLALEETDDETSVLIVSDAGAARGHRRRDRIRATAAMLHELRARTNLIAWLNPMPRARWAASSAEVIELLAPHFMFPMDPDGFSSAIDLARGLAAPQQER